MRELFTTGKTGLPGMVLSAALDLTLQVDAVSSATEAAWLAELRTGAETGCTYVEWFDDAEPRIAMAATQQFGAVHLIKGDKLPNGDPFGKWSIKCRATV